MTSNIPHHLFVGGVNPNNPMSIDTSWKIGDVVIDWQTKTGYCGELPPRHLDARGVANWLRQKLEIPPCLVELSEEENERRHQEWREMSWVLNRLRAQLLKTTKH